MLSYQHAYHAGNHADALKHIVLLDLLAGMQQKQTPLFVLDGFAGRGIYELNSGEALKNREFDTGIARLQGLNDAATPAGVRRWLQLIEALNGDGDPRLYPGSPALIRACLRTQDRLAACEMHPEEFDRLRQNLAGNQQRKQIALHKRDAYEALGALLPPKEGRGLVFLDPAYEVKNEYRRIASAVARAHERFRAGVYAIWYPLLPADRHLELFDEMKRSGLRKVLRVELQGNGCFGDMQMQGSGVLIVNPPWQSLDPIRASAAWLCLALTGKAGRHRLDWLVPE